MTQMPITNRHGETIAYTLVDDDLADELSLWKWYRLPGTLYVFRHDYSSNKRREIYMHRQIVKAPKRMHVDHINGNRLDNRRENLRVCTCSQNHCNRGAQRNNSSGHKGVFWNTQKMRWHARISADGKQHHLGFFDRVSDAAAAYKSAAARYHGAFARVV